MSANQYLFLWIFLTAIINFGLGFMFGLALAKPSPED